MRPTQGSLDESLEHAKGLLVYEIAKTRELLPSELALLDCAAEVLALREDVAACEASLKRDRHVKDELRRILESNEVVESVEALVENYAARCATLARVQALPNKWRGDVKQFVARVLADELEAALEGK